MKRTWITISVLLILALAAVTTLAQDDSTPVAGDAENPSLAVVQDFFESDFSQDFLAGSIVYDDPVFPSPIEGLEDVTATQGLFFGEVFSNARIDPAHYVVAEDTVVAEFYYTAEHTGPYYGASASGQQVTFQVAGVFEVSDNQITAIRLYYDLASLNQQVGYTPGLGAAAPGISGGGVEIVDVDDIEDDFNDYVGRVVNVSGEVDEVLSDWALVLEDEDLFDLTGQEYLLVLAGPSGVFEFSYGEGDSVTIVGTVRTFSLEDLQADLGYELDAELLGDYSDLPVIVNDVDIE